METHRQMCESPEGGANRVSRPLPPLPQLSQAPTVTCNDPVFVHWDGHAYKYVVLPGYPAQGRMQDSQEQVIALQRMIEQQHQKQLHHQQLQLHQQQQQQQHLLLPRLDVQRFYSHVERDNDGQNLHILHIPDKENPETQQYYLVSLLPNDNDASAMHIAANPTDNSSRSSYTASDESRCSSPLRLSESPEDVLVHGEDSSLLSCHNMDTPDSSPPRVLTRDAKLPFMCGPHGGLDMESPCMTVHGGAGGSEAGMFSYDIINKSEMDMYIRDPEDLALVSVDRDDLVLFPGVTIGAGGDGMMTDSCDSQLSQDKEYPIPTFDKPVIVESIESQYAKRHLVV